MATQTKIYLLILGMWLVNYLPRVLPMVVISKLKISEPVSVWLGYVPAAVLAAIIFPAIFMPANQLNLSWQNHYLIAALPTSVVAVKTRSLVWTLLVGMLTMTLLQL